MISEKALARSCRPAVLTRARTIARREGRIWDRSCFYEGNLTTLSAMVDSSSGYAESYETSITIDEVADEVFSYDCTCPAAYKYSGPCKHSIALALDFNRNTEAYQGFSATEHASTSQAVLSFLDRQQESAKSTPVRPDGEPSGSVRLKPRLIYDQNLILSLRIAGPRGEYVVRDIGVLESTITGGEYYEYGKNLAFTHSIDAFDPQDRALVRFVCRCVQNRRSYAAGRLLGRPRSYAYGYGYSFGSSSVGKELTLSNPEIDELLGLLKGCRVSFEEVDPFAYPGTRPAPRTVLVCEGEPDLSLTIEPRGESSFELVRGSDATVFATDDHLYVLQGDKLLRCPQELMAGAAFLQQVYCNAASELYLAKRDAQRFIAEALPQIEAMMPVEVPSELEELRPDPLKLSFLLDRSGKAVTCDAYAIYGERRLNLFDRGRQAEDVGMWRDVAGETAARAVVSRYFVVGRGGGTLMSKATNDAVARVVFEAVPELRRLGEVLATDAFDHLSPKVRPQVKVGVRASAGLIGLTVASDQLPARELHAILSSYRQRKRYHRLRDGSFVDLSDADFGEAALLVDELGITAKELTAGEVQVPSYKVFLLDALLTDEDRDESFAQLIEGFRTVDVDAYEPPAPLASRLRPYQAAGFRWLSALVDMGFGGILADEMGLGKSVQVISLLLARRGSGQTLIVCPASLVYNWVAEFRKFAPEIDVVAVAGDAQQRRRVREESGHEVLVTSYDLLRRDIESYADKPLWCVVLDEAQFIKNHQTLAARAVKALDARHRFALTGTPIENRLSELWSIFDFLMPGLLGGYDRFRDRYEQPIADGDEDAAGLLRAAVSPFILRRLKADVLLDLPDKLEQAVVCEMGREQRRLYTAREQALRESLGSKGKSAFDHDRIQVLAEITRLRQLCCDPSLVYEDYKGGSCKLDVICQLVSQAVDAHEKVLVFSQFTTFLSLIADRLDKEGMAYYTITGATPKQRRVELVDAFNADETPVFLVSLRAGGTGLNLVGASVVIHADPWWNIAVQDQATDRAHRIGQTRDVSVYKVIASQTIEERILALQEAKSELADQVVGTGGGTASLAALQKEDLLELLGA